MGENSLKPVKHKFDVGDFVVFVPVPERPAEGNAKRDLIGLRALFKIRPDGIVNIC